MIFYSDSQEFLLPVEDGRPVGDRYGQVLAYTCVSVAGRHHHGLVVHVQSGGVVPATWNKIRLLSEEGNSVPVFKYMCDHAVPSHLKALFPSSLRARAMARSFFSTSELFRSPCDACVVMKYVLKC